MTPNPSQKAAIDGLAAFAANTKTTAWAAFLLGSAGTGKTFTVASVVDRLRDKGTLRLGAMAPTHKARKEMLRALSNHGIGEKDLHWVGTVAAAIGKRLDLSGRNDDGSDRYTRGGGAREAARCDVIFCDEVSMVSDVDIQCLMRMFKNTGRKILFSGDFGQLRPIKGRTIQAMVEKSRIKWTLTDIMRTGDGDSDIDVVANRLREHEDFDPPESDRVLVYTDRSAWEHAFLESKEGVAIAYRNAKVDALAEKKRVALHGSNAAPFLAGEQYIVKEWPIPEIGSAEPYAYISDAITINQCFRRDIFKSPYSRIEVPVHVIGTAGHVLHAIPKADWNRPAHPVHKLLRDLADICRDLEDLPYGEDRLSGMARRWLNDQRGVNGGTLPFSLERAGKAAWAMLYFATREQLTILAEPWAYTAHSAQGSTFDEVFAHWPDLNRIDSPADRRAAKYVAVSRAARRVHVYNPVPRSC